MTWIIQYQEVQLMHQIHHLWCIGVITGNQDRLQWVQLTGHYLQFYCLFCESTHACMPELEFSELGKPKLLNARVWLVLPGMTLVLEAQGSRQQLE
jgi:hypothetical protein